MGTGTDVIADFTTRDTDWGMEIGGGPGVASTISASSALTVSPVCVTRTARGGAEEEDFLWSSGSGITVALRRVFEDALDRMVATAVELLSLALSAIIVSITI